MNSYRVLLIDNDSDYLHRLKEKLLMENYNVDVVDVPAKALDKVKEIKYHVIIINISSPRFDGLELLKKIKSYDLLIQVIMMSNSTKLDKVIQSLMFGANDYIIKPLYDIESIFEMVDFSVHKLNRWHKVIEQVLANESDNLL